MNMLPIYCLSLTVNVDRAESEQSGVYSSFTVSSPDYVLHTVINHMIAVLEWQILLSYMLLEIMCHSTIAVYLHLYNCLVIITIKYRLALHACHHSYGGCSSL